jgi:hypothetical protein
MEKTFCDMCGKERVEGSNFFHIKIEVIPSRFRVKIRDYCEGCFNKVADVLDRKEIR